MVLLFGGQLFMQTGGKPEPDFDAPIAEIQRYFETRVPTQYAIGAYLEVPGLLALLCDAGRAKMRVIGGLHVQSRFMSSPF